MDNAVEIHFPVAGMDLTLGFEQQQPKQLPNGADDDGVLYGRTTALGVNVRCYEASTARRRGGSRPGLSKYVPQAVGGITGWLVQELASISVAGPDGVG